MFVAAVYTWMREGEEVIGRHNERERMNTGLSTRNIATAGKREMKILTSVPDGRVQIPR